MTDKQAIIQIQIDNGAAIKKVVQLTNEIERNKARVKELKDAIKELDKGSDDYADQVQAMNEEIAAINVQTDNYKRNLRDTNKAIASNIRSTEQQEGSIKALRATLSKLTDAYDSLGKEQREAAEGMKMQEEIKALNDELKELEGNTGRFQRNVGDYEGAIIRAIGSTGQFSSSLIALGAAAKTAGGGMALLRGGVSSVMRTIKKNPWLLAILGITSAGEGSKVWYNYNIGLSEATRLTQQFTKLAGNELAEVRDGVSVLASEFNKDFREVLQAVNALAQQFGISHHEAFKIVRDGFIAGADAGGNYLDILREYPTFFREAGVTASEFVAISTQATTQGVFSDKGVDAIKEATIRLREMTTATRDALEGIGISSEQLQEDIRYGNITMFEAIQLVSEKLDELPPTSAKVGKAIADIFGGPGEDAGLQFLTTLHEIDTSLANVKRSAGEASKLQEEYLKSQLAMNRAISATFGGNAQSLKDLVAMAKTAFNYIVTGLLGGFLMVYTTVVGIFEAIATYIDELGKSFVALGEVMKAAMQLQWGDPLRKASKALAVQVGSMGQRMGRAYNSKVQEVSDKFSRDMSRVSPNSVGYAPAGVALDAEDTIQENGELVKRATADLERYEQQLRDIIISNTGTIIEQINHRYDAEIEALNAEYEANKANADDKLAYEKLYNDAVAALNDKRNAEIAEANKQASDEYIAMKEAEYAAINKDAALQRSINRMTMQMAGVDELEIMRQQMSDINDEISRLRLEDFDSAVALEHRITELQLQESEIRENIKTKELERASEIANASYGLFTSLSQLIQATSEDEEEATRRGKVLALAEIAFSTGVAIAEGVSSAMSVPFPGNIVAVVTTIATVLANIATAITTVKSAKFATGGLVQGAGSGTSDSIPAMLSNGESVLTARATSMFAPVLSAFNQMGGGVPIGGVAGGEEMLARAFARGAASLPAPEVAVVEITSAQKRIQLIESITRTS